IKEVDQRDVHDERLDGIERGDQPLRRPRPRAHVLGQQRFAAFPDVKNDRSAFEEDTAILLEDRHLPERLQRAVVRLVLVAQLQEASLVGEARLLERPAHAEVAHLPLREGGNPAKSGYGDHGVFSFVIAFAWKWRTSLSSAPLQPCSWERRVSSLASAEWVRVSSVPSGTARSSNSNRDSFGSSSPSQRQLIASRSGRRTSRYSPLLSCSLPSRMRKRT